MSQVELIKKPQIQHIKLDEFIPLWSEQVKELENKTFNEQNQIMIDSGLSIRRHKFCLLGEAHFFNDDYKRDCAVCYDFSYDACDVYRNQKSFENFKLTLFTHFLESHPESVMKK